MLEWLELLSSKEFWTGIMDQFGDFKFLVGMLIPIIEAFLPFLPLALFVTINVLAFGFLTGYILSYIGICIGSISVFLVLRYFGRKRIIAWVHHFEKSHHLLVWIREKGFFALFVLLCFPFTPSILVAVLSVLARVKTEDYVKAILAGKLVMVLALSFIGANIADFFSQPLKSGLFIGISVLFLFLVKKLFERYETKLKNNLHHLEEKKGDLKEKYLHHSKKNN